MRTRWTFLAIPLVAVSASCGSDDDQAEPTTSTAEPVETTIAVDYDEQACIAALDLSANAEVMTAAETRAAMVEIEQMSRSASDTISGPARAALVALTEGSNGTARVEFGNVLEACEELGYLTRG